MDRPTSDDPRRETAIPAHPTPPSPRFDSLGSAETMSAHDGVDRAGGGLERSASPRFAAGRQPRRPLGMPAARSEAVTLYRPITLVYMAAIMLMLLPVLTLVDISVATFFQSSPLPRDLDSALELSLVFSHGSGVFFVLLTIMLLAPRLRWQIPRLATLALGGGALATITKMFVLRPRPSNLDLEYVGNDSAWMWVFDWDLSQIAMFEPGSRAFPSANVVTATALTIGLWIMLPRGRVLFATIWTGVLLQRLNTGTHFLSDACGGVAIGLLWSFVCYHPKLMGTLFDRMAPEPRRRRRPRVDDRPELSDSASSLLDSPPARVHRIHAEDQPQQESPDERAA